ncbi:hypothetical protein GCM10009647_082800 [Streptomyces sanglieri]|uniref:DUF1524 domain-containing protein n=1 Tax=Streptomyces sanglieri TaxID=193460 RepID=A0ABW2WNU2_9ACTN
MNARELLAGLVVVDEDDVPGYSRAKFPHWITQHGTCDAREVVLQRDGQDVVQDDRCRAVSGTWYSEYDGLTIDSASRVDIDHGVPLKEAWCSGASQWSTPERRAFANDYRQLEAVTAVVLVHLQSRLDQREGQLPPHRESGRSRSPVPDARHLRRLTSHGGTGREPRAR